MHSFPVRCKREATQVTASIRLHPSAAELRPALILIVPMPFLSLLLSNGGKRERDPGNVCCSSLKTWLWSCSNRTVACFPLWQNRCPAPDNFIDDLDKIKWSPVRNDDITWNFEKFLVNHNGQPYRRYSPVVEPKEITEDIEKLIKQCTQVSS